MTVQRMVELLEIEHECMLRGSHGDCDRKCEDCELVQDDDELHEMYTNVIEMVRKQIPMKPKSKVRRGSHGQVQHWCGNCNAMLHGKPKYCSNCWQKVGWE